MRQMLSTLRQMLLTHRPRLKPDLNRLSWVETDLPVRPSAIHPVEYPVDGLTLHGCGNGDDGIVEHALRGLDLQLWRAQLRKASALLEVPRS